MKAFRRPVSGGWVSAAEMAKGVGASKIGQLSTFGTLDSFSSWLCLVGDDDTAA